MMSYEERLNALKEINASLERQKKNWEEVRKMREQNRKELEDIDKALNELLEVEVSI